MKEPMRDRLASYSLCPLAFVYSRVNNRALRLALLLPAMVWLVMFILASPFLYITAAVIDFVNGEF